MDQHIITTLHVMFLMTGLFACLNAWLGKWGPTVAMLGLSMGSFIAGLAIGGSIFAVIPAMLLVAIICAVRYNKPSAPRQVVIDREGDVRAISEAMLAEMERNVTARKAGRS